MIVRRNSVGDVRKMNRKASSIAIGRRDETAAEVPVREVNRIGSNKATEARYVSVLSDRTSFGPNAAIPIPLMIGPRMIPMLVVLCSMALPAVKYRTGTRKGTEADRAGVKTAEATPYKKTSR